MALRHRNDGCGRGWRRGQADPSAPSEKASAQRNKLPFCFVLIMLYKKQVNNKNIMCKSRILCFK